MLGCRFDFDRMVAIHRMLVAVDGDSSLAIIER